MCAAPLLVVAAVEVAAPAPLLWTHDQRRRIDGLYPGCELDHPVLDFIHRRADRPHVAMRRMPEARLVIENVVPQSAGCIAAPTADQMLDPCLLQTGA